MARILIVDDNDYTRLMLKGILVSGGHEVIDANDGTTIVERYEEENVDIVMMDVVMPGIDGISAAGNLKKKYPEAKIIIASAQNNEQLKKAAEELGIVGYVVKPFDTESILSMIKKAMQ